MTFTPISRGQTSKVSSSSIGPRRWPRRQDWVIFPATEPSAQRRVRAVGRFSKGRSCFCAKEMSMKAVRVHPESTRDWARVGSAPGIKRVLETRSEDFGPINLTNKCCPMASLNSNSRAQRRLLLDSRLFPRRKKSDCWQQPRRGSYWQRGHLHRSKGKGFRVGVVPSPRE